MTAMNFMVSVSTIYYCGYGYGYGYAWYGVVYEDLMREFNLEGVS